MRKIFTQILALTSVIGTIWFGASRQGLLAPSTAYALGELTIDWGVPAGSPIFTVNNFAPGQSVTESVNVTNNSSVVREVGVIGANLTGSAALAGQLEITISRGGVDLYGGASSTGVKTVAQFVAEGTLANPITLTNLNAGQTAQLDFTVKFKESAGNEFQNMSVTLDITIGLTGEIAGLPAECVGFDLSNANLVMGTRRGEILRGTSGRDVIFGLEGGDVIMGSGGDDCLVGGAGGDDIRGQNGNDILFGNDGGDSITGGDGNDQLFGGAGGDSLEGGGGSDELFGEAGGDSLAGNAGNDKLIGGAQSDAAQGGTGTDQCEAESERQCEV